jgi:hypothetical protein
LAAFDGTQIAALTANALAAVAPSAFASLTAAQYGAITAEQAASLTEAQIVALAPAQAAALSTDAIVALAPGVQAALGTQLDSLLNAGQVAELSGAQISTLTDAQIAALSGADVASLTTSEVSALTNPQIGDLGTTVGMLSDEQIQSLATTQIAALSANQVGSLAAPQFAALLDSQITAIGEAALTGITAGQIDELSGTQVASISDLGALGTSAVQAMDWGQVAALTNQQLSQLSGNAISELTPLQVSGLDASQVGSLSDAQVAALAPQQVANLQQSAAAALTVDQVQAMSADDLNALSEIQIEAISTPAIQAIAAGMVAQLAPNFIRSLSGAQIQAFSQAQFGALTAAQIADLKTNADLAQNPTDAAVVDLTTQEIGWLTSTQLSALTDAEMASLSAPQLQALTGDQINDLRTDQIIALSTEQLGELTTQQQNLITEQLANLGIESVGPGADPYTGGDSATDGGSIVDGDTTDAAAPPNFVVVDDPDGSQTEVPGTGSLLPNGNFADPTTGSALAVSTPPSGWLTWTSPTQTGSSLTPGQFSELEQAFRNWINTVPGYGSGGESEQGAIDYVLAQLTNSSSFTSNQLNVAQSTLTQIFNFGNIEDQNGGNTGAMEANVAGWAARIANNLSIQMSLTGTPFTDLVGTTTENTPGWYYAADPNDSNFQIGYDAANGTWDLQNLTTGNGVVADGLGSATTYDQAYQLYQAAFGDAPAEVPPPETYTDTGLVVGASNGVQTFDNTGSTSSLLGNTGVLQDPNDTTNFAPVGGPDAGVIGGTGSISQTVNGLISGQWYAISFSAMTSVFDELAQGSDEPDQDLGLQAAAPQTIEVSVDGTNIGEFSTAAISDTSEFANSDWQEFATAAFLGTAGPQTITFTGLGPNGAESSMTVSNLQLVQVQPVGNTTQPPGGIESLTPTQISQLSPYQVLAANDSDLQQLDQQQFQALTTQQLGVFWGAAMQRFTQKQLGWLTDSQIAGLSADQVGWLGATVLNGFSADQLQSIQSLADINLTDLSNLALTTMSSFTPAQLDTLTRSQIASLQVSQFTVIAETPQAWSGFNAAQMSGMTAGDLLISGNDFNELSVQALQGMPQVTDVGNVGAWLSAPVSPMDTEGELPQETLGATLAAATAMYDQLAPDEGPNYADGSFEDASLAAGAVAYDDTNTASTFTGSAGIAASGSSVVGTLGAADGNDVAFVQGTGSFSETITGLVADQEYALAFATAQSGSDNESFDVLVNGVDVGTFDPQSGAWSVATTNPFLVSASGTATITFQGDNTSGSDTALVDEVDLSPEDSQTVLAGGAFLQDGTFAEASAGITSDEQPQAPSPWTFTGTSGIGGPQSAAYLQGAGSFSQTVSGFEAGLTYTIAFDAAQAEADGDEAIQVLIDGNVVDTITPSDQNMRLEETAIFVPGAGTHTITFQGVNANGDTSQALVTNIRVLATGGQAVTATVQNSIFDPSSGDWAFSGDAGTTSGGTGLLAAPAGTNVAYLGTGGTIAQDVGDFDGMSSYAVSFSAAQSGSTPQTIEVLLDGTVVGTFTPGSSFQTYQTTAFTPTEGTHLLTFEAVGASGTVQLSDVEMTLLPSSPVSEDANGNPVVGHVPTQDELQRLQALSLTQAVIQSNSSQYGGDALLSVDPEQPVQPQINTTVALGGSGSYPPTSEPPSGQITYGNGAPAIDALNGPVVPSSTPDQNLIYTTTPTKPTPINFEYSPADIEALTPDTVGDSDDNPLLSGLGQYQQVAVPGHPDETMYESLNYNSNTANAYMGGPAWAITFQNGKVLNFDVEDLAATTINQGPILGSSAASAPILEETGALQGGAFTVTERQQDDGDAQGQFTFVGQQTTDSQGDIIAQMFEAPSLAAQNVPNGTPIVNDLEVTELWGPSGNPLDTFTTPLPAGPDPLVGLATSTGISFAASAGAAYLLGESAGPLGEGLAAAGELAAPYAQAWLAEQGALPSANQLTMGATDWTQATPGSYSINVQNTLNMPNAGTATAPQTTNITIGDVAIVGGTSAQSLGASGVAWTETTTQTVGGVTSIVDMKQVLTNGTTVETLPDGAADNAGGIVVTTTTEGGYMTSQRYDADGNPIGGITIVDSSSSSGTSNSGGGGSLFGISPYQVIALTGLQQQQNAPLSVDDALTPQEQQALQAEQAQQYLANVAFDAGAYDTFLQGIQKGGITGDLDAIAAGTDLVNNLGLLGSTNSEIFDDAAWVEQVDQLATALQEKGITGAFATASVGASLVAHALGYDYAPQDADENVGTLAGAWASAASALSDLATLTAPGPGSLTKDISDLQAGLSLASIASKGIATALGPVVGEIGAVLGIIEGFEQGGIEGGIEAGFSADMLTLLLEGSLASGGTATPIAIVVGLVSAIFGGNHDNPADMPDVYDTQRYGQGVADLIGAASANGTQFTENSAIQSEFGGRTGIQAVEEMLAEYGTAANAPAWLQPIFNELEGMFGESSTGSGALQIGIDGGKDVNNQKVIGVADLNGVEYQYTDLSNALYDFAARYASALAAGQAAPFSQLSN